ncbi:MAG: DNA polymerase III subunit delta [Desulfotomaculales bacterium]
MRYFEELVAAIRAGRIAPVYLWHGEEVYLQRAALEVLKAEVLAPGTESFNYVEVDGEEVSPARVVRLAQEPPVLGPVRLVAVRRALFWAGVERRSGAPDETALLAYLERPIPSTCLVFMVPQPADRRKQAYRLISAWGGVVEFAPLHPEEAAAWVAQEAKARGVHLTRDACELLVRSACGGLTGLANELEKVLAYVGDRKTVSAAQIAHVLPVQAEDSVFRVVDAVIEGRCQTALRGLKQLLLAGEPPLGILGLLARQFRNILAVNDLAATGKRPREIAAALGLKPFVVEKALAHGRRTRRAILETALEELLEVDVAVKTGTRDFYPAIADLVMRLAIHGGLSR